MRFTISGTYRGQSAFVTWQDGELTGGSAGAKREVEFLAKNRKEVGPPTGPFTYSDHLKDPISAVVLISEVIRPPRQHDGELPEWPASEPGVVL